MEEEKNTNQKIIGRTWADIFANGFFWIFILLLIFLLGYFGVFKSLSMIPIWVFYSIGMSLIFTPFMMNRAKDDSRLVVVLDDAMKLTEYRIGKRYTWNIDGETLNYTSRTGVNRVMVTDFDLTSGIAKGTALAGLTQFDLMRDIRVFNKLSNSFSEHLSQERITKEAISVEVEKRVNDISKRYLNILYGTLEPSELENALNISNKEKATPIEATIDEVIE